MPYSKLNHNAFWKSCRDDPEFRISDIYDPKFPLEPGWNIATAGSCFAQNISRYLRRSNLHFLDVEPAPKGMDAAVAKRFGYGHYSARYGNIYITRQLRQLFQDAVAEQLHGNAVWGRNGRFYDAPRPGGGSSPKALIPKTKCARTDWTICATLFRWSRT